MSVRYVRDIVGPNRSKHMCYNFDDESIYRKMSGIWMATDGKCYFYFNNGTILTGFIDRKSIIDNYTETVIELPVLGVTFVKPI